MLEVTSRLDIDYFTSLKNFYNIKQKKVFFSSTLMGDTAVFKSLGESYKFMVKTNISEISSKRLEKLESYIVKKAEELNSKELIIDMSYVSVPEKCIIFDVTNKKRLSYFSSFYPRSVKSDVVVVYQEKDNDGKYGEDKLGCLAIDSDRLQSLATFQNVNCRISRTDFPIKKYGCESAYKIFSKLMAFEFKIPTHIDISEYLIGGEKNGCQIEDNRKTKLMEVFSPEENALREREDVIEGDIIEVGPTKLSLTEIVSKGKVPFDNRLIDVTLDFEIGWKITECYTRAGWLYFVIDDTDGRFWEDYHKNREELLETLGGLEEKVSILKYNTNQLSIFKELGEKGLEEDDDEEYWKTQWYY